MYRLLVALLLFLAALFLAVHFAEGKKLLLLLRQGRPLWVMVALLLELLFLVNLAGFYHALYCTMEIKESWRRLLVLVIASSFVSLVTPGGSLSGTALIVADAVKRGAPPARAVLINLLFYLFDYGAFALVLVGVFSYLGIKGTLTFYEITAALLLLAFVAAQLLLILAAIWRPRQLLALSQKVLDLALFLVPHRYRASWRARSLTFLHHLTEAAGWLTQRPHGLGRVGLHALLVEVLGIAVLGAVFVAFVGRLALGTLLITYAVGMLFLIVSITPSGIGFVEGAMTATFTSLGVSPGNAVLVTFVYRGITVWFPFLAGMISLHWLRKEEVARIDSIRE
ncbi:lysylphosphatidylglycerol synthase transmembrane domain-containing protein [Desulfothermobacter acidiphilus]|uniref:lysylphosphatidylglycerol synthase transmembrane domain-containing protein n=1 Tax=Desulfothermobacter acidiphilus TaxID=1938353 RepID=UPI003F8AAE68